MTLQLSEKQSISFELSIFESLFPFAFAFNQSLNIIFCNQSLRKIAPELVVGQKLPDDISVTKPRIDFSFEALSSRLDVLHTWQINPDVKMQGQLFADVSSKWLIFVGSPIINKSSTLKELGLQAGDFALHDNTLSNLFMLQAQQTAVSDSAQMVEALRKSAKEKAELAKIQSDLAQELDIGFDLKIRFNNDGFILDSQLSKTLDKALDAKKLIGKSVYEELSFLSEPLKFAAKGLKPEQTSIMFDFSVCIESEHFYFEARLAKTSENDYLLLAGDVTQRHKMQIRLQRRANFDSLTQLANRTYFKECLERSIDNYSDKDSLVTVLNIDLRGFKYINTRYGNAAGDHVLKMVAEVLFHSVGEEDTPARVGGDEFMVLFDNRSTRQEMLKHAQVISQKLNQSIIFEGNEIKCDSSIGVAFWGSELSHQETLLHQANLAMQEAKHKGKSEVCEYIDGMYEQYKEKLELHEKLIVAIENNALNINYQPIVCADSERIKGFEALARWIDDEKGFVPPDVFIAIAEENGLMIPLGRCIMAVAFKHFSEFVGEQSQRKTLTLALNVSVHQLYDIGFIADLQDCMSQYNLTANQVILEITETAFIRDIDVAIGTLKKLKQHGFTLALDDFGTGFSSLAYLEQLPFDILKIDRSFINKIENEDSYAPLVKAIVSIAEELKFETVAEGIETQSQQAFLQRENCMYLQGYYFSRPLNVEQLHELDI